MPAPAAVAAVEAFASAAGPPIAGLGGAVPAKPAASAAADAVVATAAAAPAPVGPSPATPASAAPAASPASATALAPDDPPPAAPFQFEPFRPGQRLVRALDEATKAAARQTVADLRAARGDPPSSRSPTSATMAAGPLAPAPSLARPPPTDLGPEPGPAYALTTRPLRTRAESEQVQTAVRALLAQHTTEPLIVELMPDGDDWRVVCWPFPRRQDAQLARALLLTRGLRLQAVEF